ncbi:MAG: hypothetical protein IPN27_12470 [Cellvibrionales bacterium]|nr:hypothetical protein [Cellvibrionales bacterium]
MQRIDFDRLDTLVSERMLARSSSTRKTSKKAEGGKELHDAICRDLILPCVGLLTNFLEAVK